MKLQETILKEHSKAQSLKIVRYIGNNAARFKELVEVFLAGPYRVTQRAAWPLSLCVEAHPDLIRPHLNKILHHLKKPGIHDSVKRNTIRLLQFIKIPKASQGKVAAICFDYLSNTGEPIAVRVFAMTVLGNIAQEEPDLRNEIIPLIEDQLPFASAGFLSRARKVLKELKG